MDDDIDNYVINLDKICLNPSTDSEDDGEDEDSQSILNN